jgi:molybdopterin molybdotransferase
VVPLERCRVDHDEHGEHVQVPADAVRAGAHVRGRGSDIAAGDVALPAGRVLSAGDLGLLASLGVHEVSVRRRLKVALLSTGDELALRGQPLRPGQVHDSNRVMLAAALRRIGAEVLELDSTGDDPRALEATLRHAAHQADAVVTSGGVSGGDADHTRGVLARLGRVVLWQVAMRPGRPFAFGQLDREPGSAGPAWLFALPGTQVAALVCWWMLVRDALWLLAGALPQPLPALQLPAAAAIAKQPGRTEFVRGHVEAGADGRSQVRAAADQGASALRALSQANALIVLDDERGPVAAGEWVPVHLFEGLL